MGLIKEVDEMIRLTVAEFGPGDIVSISWDNESEFETLLAPIEGDKDNDPRQ